MAGFNVKKFNQQTPSEAKACAVSAIISQQNECKNWTISRKEICQKSSARAVRHDSADDFWQISFREIVQ